MASTAKMVPPTPISLVDEDEPGIEHISIEDEENTQDGGETQSTQNRKSTRTPSVVWAHFIKIRDSKKDPKAKCKYCGVEYARGSKRNGSSNLLYHIENKCNNFPGRANKKQATVCFGIKKGEGLVTHKYDPEGIREYIAKMIVKDEQPFSFVENEGFKELIWKIEPRFQVPSRTTITKDVMNLYIKEKENLKEFFLKNKQRVCLTTDTWKSCQNLHYMCLTAHFIDRNWVLHKKILNYCVVPNSKGETLGKAIEQCLLEWGLERVFTITLDNASSNNVSVQYVKNTVNQWTGAVLRGEHMHLRCASHILNLIVQDGLEEYNESIIKIRDVVRYVRSSSTRMQKLKECVEQAKITCKKTVSLDVPTRWNSTYLMLEAAEKYQKAFERMEQHDVGYVKEFCNGEVKTCPNESDWDNARLFIKFLKIFHDCTLRFYGSKYVTTNQFVDRVSFIHSRLQYWCGNLSNGKLATMAKSMMKKYEKYWGKIESLNQFLLVAVLLDPRYKEPFLNVCFEMMCGNSEEASRHCAVVRKTLDNMYKEYYKIDSTGEFHASSSTNSEDACLEEDIDEYTLFDQLRKKKLKAADYMENDYMENRTEVDRYFIEACESNEQTEFDVLKWWKNNANRFRILSLIAQDIFAISVSTVASESAFSTGGRIVNSYRSCLSTKTVQALVCSQNWIRQTTSSSCVDYGAIEEVEALEAEVLAGVAELRLDT